MLRSVSSDGHKNEIKIMSKPTWLTIESNSGV
jgi:hypothetical protein